MTHPRIRHLFFAFLLVSAVVSGAQEVLPLTAPNPEAEALLERALQSADAGDWDNALKMLDEVEKIVPDDPRVQSYRASFLELSALEDAQQSWVEGESTEVRATGSSDGAGGDGSEEPPKFVLDRGEKDLLNKPAMFRDHLRADLSLKLFAVNPVTNEIAGTWSSGNEFLYSSLRFDLRYWMPFLGRSIGFNFRSNGYSWEPGEPETLYNTLDLGINLRGFLLESVISRLEIGIDFGASLQTVSDTTSGTSNTFALYLGLWASDPIFYHLFRVESLEPLVFGGGLRIYSTAENQLSDNIVYRLDGAWQFKNGFSGVRLEWWDFLVSGDRTTMMSFSLFGGYRY